MPQSQGQCESTLQGGPASRSDAKPTVRPVGCTDFLPRLTRPRTITSGPELINVGARPNDCTEPTERAQSEPHDASLSHETTPRRRAGSARDPSRVPCSREGEHGEPWPPASTVRPRLAQASRHSMLAEPRAWHPQDDRAGFVPWIGLESVASSSGDPVRAARRYGREALGQNSPNIPAESTLGVRVSPSARYVCFGTHNDDNYLEPRSISV